MDATETRQYAVHRSREGYPWRRLPHACVRVILALLLSMAPAAATRVVVLPRPTFSNSFCLFPIDEQWHVTKPGDREALTRTIDAMRATVGPERLYARLGVAVISEGNEPEAYSLARDLGIGLVLQGGAIEHHSVAWGFPSLLHDPVRGDRRFAQWFQDGRIADPGKENDLAFGIRACSSCYARPVYNLRKQVEMARAVRIARAMRTYPDVIVACSGPIECEMHQGDNRWGDYSPFTIEEFRDYLTHRGIYAPGGERQGLGFPGGGIYAQDPSPAKARGHHPSFNEVFGTHFTTWSLRYWDPDRFPRPVPLSAPGMPAAGAVGTILGGFDAPRVWPGQAGTAAIPAEGNDRYWEAWAGVTDTHPGFRSKLLNWWVGDHTRWLAEAGVPRKRDFSHQIPGESYGLGRLSRGASAVWTAATPHGSIGITTYFGAASDADVFEKIVRLSPNWGDFEYHPHPIDSLSAPVSEYLHSLYTCIRFRAHILTPIDWPQHGKDFVVSTGPFAVAMKQVMASLPDQPYYNRTYVDYSPPPVTGLTIQRGADGVRVTWSRFLWPGLRFTWADWSEFNHFELHDSHGALLASTRDETVTLPTAAAGRALDGLTVVAVKQVRTHRLPAITGLGGYRGRLHWNECNDFFCDHYRIEIFSRPGAVKPLVTGSTRQAAFQTHVSRSLKEVWCRVAACDASGACGPYSPLVRISLPRPGQPVVDLQTFPARFDNSPDTRWREMAVGGITQSGLFQHPPLTGGGWARARYRLTLPPARRGQRIVFVADNGIADSAGQGDGIIFRVDVDGRERYRTLILPDHQWHPVEVDLTAAGGMAVTLDLMTNANVSSASDWGLWGDPQVLITGAGVSSLPTVTGIVALGKEVRGRVTLRWQDRTSNGTLWSRTPGFAGFRIYRGAGPTFQPGVTSRLGTTRTFTFVDAHFDGRETYYRVTALFRDGRESPPSEAVQYAP